MIVIRPLHYVTQMTVPDLVDFLKYKPDGIFRVLLNNGKVYQVIKSKGEVTTVVNPTGYVFRRNIKLSNSVVAPDWVDVDKLDDINTFLLMAQVKGWI